MRRRDSLARGVPPSEPGTLHAQTGAGAVAAGPEPGRVVRFGRGERPGTDLTVGDDDLRVSRRHGELTYRRDRWWLRNTGRLPLRLPRGGLLPAATAPAPLATGYTPLFVKGSGYREYLIELYVRGEAHPPGSAPAPLAVPLTDDERLLLVVLGQRYLRHEPGPRPLPHRQAVQQLRFLCPGPDWKPAGIDRRVAEIATRLPALPSVEGGPQEAGEPLHLLLTGLVAAAVLVPPDLALLAGHPDV